MKQLLFCLLLLTVLSCNNNEEKMNSEKSVNETNTENKSDISGSTKDKEDFISTCHIDASNSFGGEKVAQVNDFCECAWGKLQGKYPGEIIATRSKLEKDPVLQECYENAKKK
ncbi:MAG: hypothetical protein ACR2KX_15705 [Chitinophagaceae bacterium]